MRLPPASFLFPILFLIIPIASAFTVPLQISGTGENASGISLAVTSGGVAHAAWLWNGSVQYADSAGGAWGRAAVYESANLSAPALAADSSGRLLLLFPSTGETHAFYSADGGRAWEEQPPLDGDCSAVASVAGSNGTIGAIGMLGGSLLFARFTFGVQSGVMLLDSSGRAAQARIAANPLGGFGVVWANGSNSEIYFADTRTGSIAIISDTIGSSESPDIAFDSAGTAHIVWRDANDTSGTEPGRWDIWYAQYACSCSGVKEKKDISLTPGSESGSPRIAIDPQDGIHVAWDEGWPGARSLLYSKSPDGGLTWGGPIVIPGSQPLPSSPLILADGNGRLHTFWVYGGLWHSAWNGTDWLQAGEIPSPASAPSEYLAAIDSENRVHAVFLANGTVYYSSDSVFGRNTTRQLRLELPASGCAGAQLAITVRDEADSPAQNALVSVSRYDPVAFTWSEVANASTDSSGSTLFSPDAAGYYRVSVEKPGYLRAEKYSTIAGCGLPTPTPSGTPTATPAQTPTEGPSATPTASPEQSPTPLPTEVPKPGPCAAAIPLIALALACAFVRR